VLGYQSFLFYFLDVDNTNIVKSQGIDAKLFRISIMDFDIVKKNTWARRNMILGGGDNWGIVESRLSASKKA
jgi:hypothetical protein